MAAPQTVPQTTAFLPPVWHAMHSILMAVGPCRRRSPIGIAQNGPDSDILAVEWATRDEMLAWLPWFGLDAGKARDLIPSGPWRGWLVQLSSCERATVDARVNEQADRFFAQLADIPVTVVEVPATEATTVISETTPEPHTLMAEGGDRVHLYTGACQCRCVRCELPEGGCICPDCNGECLGHVTPAVRADELARVLDAESNDDLRGGAS